MHERNSLLSVPVSENIFLIARSFRKLAFFAPSFNGALTFYFNTARPKTIKQN